MNKKNINRTSFLLSFAISIFAFFSVVLIFSQVGQLLQNNADAPAEQNAQNIYLPTAQENLTVLIIGKDSSTNIANTFALLKFDVVNSQISVLPLPSNLTISYSNHSTDTLTAVCKFGGSRYLKTELANYLQIPIDRYVTISQSAFLTCADLLGKTRFVTDYDIDLGEDMQVKSGMHLLASNDMAMLLTSENYPTEAERCRVSGDLIAQIINNRMDIIESSMIDTIFKAMVNVVDTDISYTDYHDRKEAAAYLHSATQTPAVAISLSTAAPEREKSFTLSTQDLEMIKKTFTNP